MDTVTLVENAVEETALVTPCIYRIMRLADGESAGAVYSLDETYRYVLWRVWDITKPLWMYGMLNPSTATELELDPTIFRCRVRAERAGAGGILVLNSGGIRETDALLAIKHPDPIGPHNEQWLRTFVPLCDVHIAGYGSHAKKFGGDRLFARVFRSCGVQLQALRVNADGSPGHPLYISYNQAPFAYNVPM